MPKYRLSQAASDDLVTIYRDGTTLFGEAQADRYYQGLGQTFAFLAETPRAARLRNEISTPVRAFPYKAHLIVYEVAEDDKTVTILRVRHGREDWMSEE